MNDFIKQDQDRLKLFKRYGYDMPKARNLIIAKAGISRGRILEVGTGRGHMAVALVRKGLKLISIDLDRKAQQIAKAKLKAMKLDKLVTLKVMNAERLKYKDNTFDYVVSVNFIHHAKNPVKCLKEMVRVAKNKLIIADLNKKGERIMEKVHGLDGHSHPASKMSLKDAKAFLEKSGMIVNVYEDTCQTILVTKKEA
jgi:ubiquinone/menaquinone biosynthesis C-methylase UbiE